MNRSFWTVKRIPFGLLSKRRIRLSAYLKCLQEKHAGNSEFGEAYTGLEEKLRALHMPEVDTFMKEYAPAFLLSLDEMNT